MNKHWLWGNTETSELERLAARIEKRVANAKLQLEGDELVIRQIAEELEKRSSNGPE